MKICEVCGCEIAGKDGDNRCVSCDLNGDRPAFRRPRRRQKRDREEMLKSLGLVKVRGALGGTYWE